MKHTSIILTPENQRQIAGRLDKFFNNSLNNFYHWHNYDSGWNFDKYEHGKKSLYPNATITVTDYGIKINYGRNKGYAIKFGARLRFQNNKILIQNKWDDNNTSYIYLAFQLTKEPILKRRNFN